MDIKRFELTGEEIIAAINNGRRKNKHDTRDGVLVSVSPEYMRDKQYALEAQVAKVLSHFEPVELEALGDEEINPYWEIWSKNHYEEAYRSGNEVRVPVLIKNNTVYLATENSRTYSEGSNATINKNQSKGQLYRLKEVD